ncbi:hypothetical protein BDB01DRAFT_779831 [Pilobolus umbonatus]|nr:hypothetical protein BDB01DRAFT_779831 [Pilobolus umbonatus]
MRSSIAMAVAGLAFAYTASAGPLVCSETHVVLPGDSCFSIGLAKGISATRVIALNYAVVNPECTNLMPGQILCVKTVEQAPTKKTTKKTTSAKTIKKISNKLAPIPGAVYTGSKTVQITSADDFCLFLPKTPGGKDLNNGKPDIKAIAKSETSAIAFCTKNNEHAIGASSIPNNFIKTAHYYQDTVSDYVQITGLFRPSAYELNPNDEGGQYDDHGKSFPPLSHCFGYKYYVSLIEPNANAQYCLRCCNNYQDCNAGRSEYGCRRVVSNGIYN